MLQLITVFYFCVYIYIIRNDEYLQMILQEINYFPEHQDEPYPGQDVRDYVEFDPNDEDEHLGEKTYIKPLTENGIYHVLPIQPKLAMGEVFFDVRVPTNIVPYEDGELEIDEPVEPGQPQPEYDIEGAIVRLSEQGLITTPTIVQNLQGQIERTQLSINSIANVVAQIQENTYKIEKMDVDFTEVNSEINTVVNNLYSQIKADFNQITNVYNTTIADVKINNDFKEEITVNMEQKIKKITEINVNNIVSSLNVVSQNQNILVSDITAIKDFLIKMYGKKFFENPVGTWQVTMDTPNSKRKCIEASSSTEPPQPMDTNLLENNNENNEQNNNQNVNENVNNVRSFKKMRGPVDGDVSDPVRQSYYWNDVITVDAMNEKYNKDYYGLFEVQHVTEVPMLDRVYIKITENNPDFVWNIDSNYVNTDKNIMENDPAGYNPLGVREFHVEIAVDGNKLKEINEFSTLNIGNESIDIASYNNAIVKYNGNNQINPQEITNERRLRVVDEYEGEGKTVYDNNEKIFINSHKYTIEEENENCDESNEGFKKVLQTTIVPIMDKITVPTITSNKTIRYSIEDFNNIYSLSPGSQNTYRNDFIGFNTIDIPVNVNNKVVAGFGSTPNIYRPSDFDPDAIGFSSFQIEGTRDSGGGSGGSSVFNLENYTFRHNNNQPYTISEYNQQNNTNFTGFDRINVDVGSLSNLDLVIDNIGNYTLNYNNGLVNVMPVMTSNNSNNINLSGSEQYGGDGSAWTYFRLFDGNKNNDQGFHSLSNDGRAYLLINFNDNPKKIEAMRLFQRGGFSGSLERSPGHVKVEVSNDDIEYEIIFDGDIEYNNMVSNLYEFNNSEIYQYYKFDFEAISSNTVVNFSEMELYEFTGGYKNVNVKVNTGNLLLTGNMNVDTIENNVSKNYIVPQYLNSFIPVMSGNNSNGARIVSQINSHSEHNAWTLFDDNDGTYYELTTGSETASFIINIDNPDVLRSVYYLFQVGNQAVNGLKISGSNDGENFVELYNKNNVYDRSINLVNNKNYIYDNIENEESYSYFKIETTRYSTSSYLQFWTLKLFNTHKYVGFDKLTVVNNTYSKTADPVVADLQPNNQRVYVNTSNSSLYPYVRRNWMTVPLEDKVIKYKGYYNPSTINVSSGYYGIRSITFENEGVFVCENLVPHNAEIGVNVEGNTFTFSGGTVVKTQTGNANNSVERYFNGINENCNHNGYGGKDKLEINFDTPKNVNCVKLYMKGGDTVNFSVTLKCLVNNQVMDLGTVTLKNPNTDTLLDYTFYANTYYSQKYYLEWARTSGDTWYQDNPGEIYIMHCDSGSSNFEEKDYTVTKNGEYLILPDLNNYLAMASVNLNVNVPIQNIKNVNIPTYGDSVILPDDGYQGIKKVNLTFDKPNYVSSVSLIRPEDVPADTIHVSATDEYYFNTGAFKIYCNQGERYFNRLFFDEFSLQYVDMENVDLVIECNNACIINSFALFAVGSSGYVGKPSFYVSIDGSNWNLLYHSDEEIQFNTWSEFNFVNDNIYKWYKITTEADGGYIRFARIQYCEESGYIAPTKPLYPNYALNYNDSGVYQITPPNGYDGFSSATLSVNIPLQSKTVTLTTWGNHGWNYFYPDNPNKGFSSFAVYLTNDPEYKLEDFKLYYRNYQPDNTNINVDIDGANVSNIGINSWKEYNVNNSTYTLRPGYGIVYMTYKWQHVDVNVIFNNNQIDTTDPDYDPDDDSVNGNEILTMDIQTQTVEHGEPFSWKVFISEFPLQYMLNGNDELEGEIVLSYQTSGRIILRGIYSNSIGLNSMNCYLYDSWINKNGANVTIIN